MHMARGYFSTVDEASTPTIHKDLRRNRETGCASYLIRIHNKFQQYVPISFSFNAC